MKRDGLARAGWGHAVDQDGARGDRAQASDQAEKRGFAAAGWAEDAHELARRDGEADVIENVLRVTEAFADRIQADGRDAHVGDGRRGRHHARCSAKTGSRMQDGCPGSWKRSCVDRCQFHESANRGGVALEELRSKSG